MKYVKHFDILGVDTAQIPCIELHGVPTTATVGVVGLLGMDINTGEVYKCTKVNGSIYTWESLTRGRDGTSVVNAEVNSDGELVLILSNGKTINVGVVKGVDGRDGEKGADGKDGCNIVKAYIYDGILYLQYSDGTTSSVGYVGKNGEDGKDGGDGISIVDVELRNYKLIVTLSNGTTIDAGSITTGNR